MVSRFALFVLLAGACLAQDAARMDQIVQSYVANHQFMGTALVARGSQVLFSKLRKMIEDVRLGKPDYDTMSPALATTTRQQLSQLQPMITQLGSIQSITFKGVGEGCADIYQVKLEKGSLEYRIWLAPDGKVESANVRPVQ